MSFLTHALGSITTFFPTIVDTLGYNPTNTLLLTAPPYSMSLDASDFHTLMRCSTGLLLLLRPELDE